MLWAGLLFFSVFLVISRLWDYAFDNSSSSWPGEVARTAFSAVLWVFAMRWWSRRQLAKAQHEIDT